MPPTELGLIAIGLILIATNVVTFINWMGALNRADQLENESDLWKKAANNLVRAAHEERDNLSRIVKGYESQVSSLEKIERVHVERLIAQKTEGAGG